ncbi:SGNH/GDSL hydrolase family protein [Actinoplanes couchii]|uniref:SGNH hydrolase n=1 Tax=Actinoplanes couchii TaxID=403638 RepID=A0ABQ3X797_9ACTN|nr:SGNH/GDSL hydrolase family protein [Actinoplanes couchii]MDR6322184.1 lysophospholipase L1-like esterase [Actinoplanes couchii]GID54349.1 SGNH hydrolase [Actinoplanes couchii]
MRRRTLLGAASPLLIIDSGPPPRPRWIHAWTAAPQLTERHNLPPEPFTALSGTTLRQTVRVGLGGRGVRVRFANVFGAGDLSIAAAAVAVPDGGRAGAVRIEPGSSRPLTFGGERGVTVPAGAQVVSDPVDMAPAARANLTITTYLREGLDGGLTSHPGSRTTSWLIEGDRHADVELPAAVPIDHWYLISGVEVLTTGASALVILGDSLTDGRGSTTNGNNRWPDLLQDRLRDPGLAILNQAAAGNRVLRDGLGPNALARLDRDVLAIGGAARLLVFAGVNDLGTTVASEAAQRRVAAELIAGYRQIVVRARACGLRTFGATLTPFGGNIYDDLAGVRETARQSVNSAIRGGLFEGYADFDEAVRDPVAPWRLHPGFDAGDHLHLNPVGHAALAAAVPTRLASVPAGSAR